MSGMNRSRTRHRKFESRRTAPARRKRSDDHDSAQLSNGAAAAERASAGIGTEESEPADWLFGDSLANAAPRPN
jgi:hypothetical protein